MMEVAEKWKSIQPGQNKRSRHLGITLVMVAYKLSYFDIRAYGENSRQILAYAGKEFEDHRQSRDDWEQVKPTTPFGQLPLLTINGSQTLAQSHAISRFLAREFKINGKTPWEEAQVNSLADQFKDYQTEIRPYNMVKWGFVKGDADKLYQEVFLPSFKKNYQFFTNFLKSSGSGWLIGDSLTWVDLLIAEHTSDLLAVKNSVFTVDEKVFDEFPELKEHQKRVHEVENIKKWLEKRPVTPF